MNITTYQVAMPVPMIRMKFVKTNNFQRFPKLHRKRCSIGLFFLTYCHQYNEFVTQG